MGHINEVQHVPYEGKPLSLASNSLFETVCVSSVALTRDLNWAIYSWLSLIRARTGKFSLGDPGIET